MTIWASSDLHINYPENWAWWNQLSEEHYQQDSLILAGDVHHEMEALLALLRSLVPKFERVFFVVGNHDLWLELGDVEGSLRKFERLMTRLEAEGVYTRPWLDEPVNIVPLPAWYDYSFGTPSRTLKRAWQDFDHCQWSHSMEALTQYFLNLYPPPDEPLQGPVVTFSHFMPRRDLLPLQGPKIVEMILPVLGSTAIDERARAWGSHYHIYGHHHLNRSVTLEGVHYLNNAFGYPKETGLCRKALLPIYRNGWIVHEQYPPMPEL